MKIIFAAFAIFFSTAVFPQTVLLMGDSVDRTISKGELHKYKMKITKGVFYKTLVYQNGIDIQIKLTGNGSDSVYDSPNGINGPEPVEFLATTTGYAQLDITPLESSSNTKTGKYTIHYIKQISANEYSKTIRQEEEEKKEFINWIKQNAVPLKTVQAGSGFEDLEWLKPILKDKRVIAVGEATHGTKEFSQMKHRLLEFLVTELGFSVFGIEASYGRCKYINDYVLTGKGDPDTAAIIQGFWTWGTEEFKDMIQWIRNYNEAHPEKKVSFVGFDLQLNDAVEFAISDYYSKVDLSKKIQVDTLLKRINRVEMSGSIFSGDTTIRTLIIPLETMISNFLDKAGEYILKSSPAQYDEILWDQKILHQYLVSYSYFNSKNPPRKENRDFYMAQNILSSLTRFSKGTKMMIWAHNGHVAKDLDRAPNMGTYLEQALKNNYYVIGFDFYKGSFQAFDMDSSVLKEETVGEAPENNLSSYFVKAGLGNSFLDLSSTDQNDLIRHWLNEKVIGTHGIGSEFSKKWKPSNYILPVKLKHAFDGIIFIKESSKAIPLKWLTIDRYNF